MEDFGAKEVANDHRMKASADKRNMYLVDVILLNNVTVMVACSRVDKLWQVLSKKPRRVSGKSNFVLRTNDKQTQAQSHSTIDYWCWTLDLVPFLAHILGKILDEDNARSLYVFFSCRTQQRLLANTFTTLIM